MIKNIKIGLIQMNCPVDDSKINFDRAVNRIEKLASEGAQIICLPELFKTQYFCQKRSYLCFVTKTKAHEKDGINNDGRKG